MGVWVSKRRPDTLLAKTMSMSIWQLLSFELSEFWNERIYVFPCSEPSDLLHLVISYSQERHLVYQQRSLIQTYKKNVSYNLPYGHYQGQLVHGL